MAHRLSSANASRPLRRRSSPTPRPRWSSSTADSFSQTTPLGRCSESQLPTSFWNASLNRGSLEPGLTLQTRSGIYVPTLRPAQTRGWHPTVICLLIRQRWVDPAFESLTERERGVVMLLIKGLTNAEIAGELTISVETVRKHVAKALEKTETKTRAGLVGRALGR
jgi:DNA-binding CsgD family transcriptional regulator